MFIAGLGWDSLDHDFLTSGLGVSLSLIVLANALDESLSGLRVADVLDADVDTLWDYAATDTLVDDDTDGVLCNVEDFASLSVVEFVRHALLDGTVSDDINVVALFVDNEEFGEGSSSVLSKGSGKQISSSSSKSEAMWHLSLNLPII